MSLRDKQENSGFISGVAGVYLLQRAEFQRVMINCMIYEFGKSELHSMLYTKG